MEGKIKWFSNSKGYGFIGREDGPDVFVHYSGIVGDGYRALQEEDRVSFEIVQGAKGPQAARVVVTDDEQAACIVAADWIRASAPSTE
jgi:cold shock protein